VVNLREAIGEVDLLLMTLDTLRYDAASKLHLACRTPFLSSLLPDGWEERHSPGNFTYAAHAAFFAGFLPTPAKPGVHLRRFAVSFPGATTIGPETAVFDAPDIVTGLRKRGYRTVCIGGVGFFNGRSPLGSVFPSHFDESHWEPEFGVACPDSTRHQVRRAAERVASAPGDQPLFLFLNLSAIHQPNRCYLPGALEDSLASHEAALEYTDGELPPLMEAFRLRKRGGFGIVTSDHGTMYGEEGYMGHRIGHPLVWSVPYGEFTWGPAP
jgi:hypothetical protein